MLKKKSISTFVMYFEIKAMLYFEIQADALKFCSTLVRNHY